THAPLAVCLIVVMLAPFVTVIGYEMIGREHQRRMLEEAGVG
ncbi:low temperature requirement protein A, partial [Streptomyces sp. SID8455]|nr:low temperature requirement protein A [Streptomyces sp. SID8455]